MNMKTDSSVCQGLQKGHDVMTNILSSRSMRLSAAITLWNKQNYLEFLSYIQKTNDDALLVDVLPIVQKQIEEDEKTKEQIITLGACSDLMPLVKGLLNRKYENYKVVALDFVRCIIKKWFLELREMNRNKTSNLGQSLSLSPVYFAIFSLLDQINELSKKPGLIGNKASVVKDLFQQL